MANVAEPAAPAPEPRQRILFIDADPILREFAVVNLASETTFIDTAPDPEVAFAILRAGGTDLLILDLEPPAAGGLEMIATLKADPRLMDVPVVVVAGRDDIHVVERAFAAGATSFAVKPLNWRLLGAHLKFVRRSAERERALRAAADAAAERCQRLAAAGAQFVAEAIHGDPGLKAAAGPFARAASEALKARAAAA